MNTYIKNTIQQPIERMLNTISNTKDMAWYDVKAEIEKARTRFGLFQEVYEVLIPLYKRYIMADPVFFNEKRTGKNARNFMSGLLDHEERYIFQLFRDINLVDCAKNWSKYPNMEKHLDLEFSCLLETLFCNGYDSNLEAMKKELCVRLSKKNEYGNYKELEMYCILMAHILVYEKKDLPEEKKKKLYRQIRQNWGFLKYIYSLMLKHIIGLKSPNFAQVLKSLCDFTSFYHYMYLAYKALNYNINGLYREGEKDNFDSARRLVKDIIEVKRAKLQDIVKSNERNEDIIPLIKILFPKKIEEVLNQECPKTYIEIEKELAGKDEVLKNLVEKLVEKTRTSVSIEELEKAFAPYSVSIALEYFDKVNSLLVGNDVWTMHAVQIKNSIINRSCEKADTVTIQNTFMKDSCQFQAGSTMQGDVHQ